MSMLTMALIGCLPDNVQQAIKSFSIKPGKQHITFAFPFMEHTLRLFCNTGQILRGEDHTTDSCTSNPVLFFDECLEVIQGFQTYVTVLPYPNKSSLPVVILTLYQRDTTEGICRHFQSIIRILFEQESAPCIWKIPIMVAELGTKCREMILDICSETIAELQSENLCHAFPGKQTEQQTLLVKEKILRPHLLSYPEFLRRNTQDVLRNLTTTDPAYFMSLVELLQSTSCSILDFKKVDMMFKNPGIDPAIRQLWKTWGHEQISRKVFPVTRATAPQVKLSPLYDHRLGPAGGVTFSTGPETLLNVGGLSQVPVKEGLQSVIKCLKSQEISQIKPKEQEHDGNLHACNCNVCKIQPKTRRTNRPRLNADFSKQEVRSSEVSAFRFPFQDRSATSLDNHDSFCSRSPSFRIPSATFSYHHHHSTVRSGIVTTNYSGLSPPELSANRNENASFSNSGSSVQERCTYASVASSRTVVQPVPHYFPINFKAFSQRVLYGYPMLNDPQYSVAVSSRPNL